MSKPETFSKRLLDWWDRHGRHDLPWQHPRTPFRVWVSEIMLQQTQVKTVIPYFERWMARFPDLESLATADVDDVLAIWAGLGYYARARNLHKAAQECMREHHGAIPDQPGQLAALPGIGESTANAIISQAHNQPLAVLDGNARRVLSRHAAIEGWPGKPRVLKQFWSQAQSRLPATRGADYTQAIMDLGATVCTHLKPKCGHCPVTADCKANQAKAVDRYPARKPAITVQNMKMHVLLLQRADGAVLMERRPSKGIWGGLWSLPDGPSPDELAARFGLQSTQLKTLPELSHRLTHRKLAILPLRGNSSGRIELSGEKQQWCLREEWQALGIPRPVLRLLEMTDSEPD